MSIKVEEAEEETFFRESCWKAVAFSLTIGAGGVHLPQP